PSPPAFLKEFRMQLLSHPRSRSASRENGIRSLERCEGRLAASGWLPFTVLAIGVTWISGTGAGRSASFAQEPKANTAQVKTEQSNTAQTNTTQANTTPANAAQPNAAQPNAGQASDLAYDPTRFELTALASGLRQPMELCVASTGEVFYIELDGKLKAWSPALRGGPPRLVGELTVTTAQENGLIGMALDPEFAANSWIYLQYSPPDFPGQHISRFTIRDGQLDLSSEKLLLKYEEQRKECCHHAGSMQFGPRGELFIATGDNTHPHGDSQGYAPLDERPDRAPWDAQKSSANTHSYNGKILRIKPTPDGGYEIPDGNLFPRDGSKGRPEIYVMGCRNPWRMTVDAKTGFVYWGEVGPDAGGDGPRGPRGYDEINQARKAGNFGWPYFIANNQPYADVDFATGQVGAKYDPLAPINASPNNTGERQLPPAEPAFLYYPYGSSTEFPELGQGGRTACAGPVYHYSASSTSPTKFPAAFDGRLFIFEWTRNWIKTVRMDEQHNPALIEPFLPNQPFSRPIDMEFGPDGSLYLIEYGETWGLNANARLVRIDYMAGNRMPVAVANAENNIGKEPLAVKFSSLGSLDKDAGDTLSYEWKAIGAAADSVRVIAREANPTVMFDEPGVYTVELTVSDPHGGRRSATVPVVVGNSRPKIRFVEPAAGGFFDPDQPIAFKLLVDDAEDGTNDYEVADRDDRDFLDSTAVSRVSLNAVFAAGPPPSAAGGPAEIGPPGMRLMKGSDCFNCHAVDQKRVGPTLLEIATKYRGQAGAIETSVQRVRNGSTGVWGKIPMIPHSQHTVDELREMVSWVYSLQPDGLVRVFHGFVGEIPVAKDEAAKAGHFRLEASYADRGAGTIPPLNASATLILRPRRLEAESADVIGGPQVLGAGSASGGKFIGAINHGHSLRFTDITFDTVRRIGLRIASAGAGGAIELRLDKPDGPLLATVPVEVNGHWEKFYERVVELPPTSGRHDLVVRFTHPGNASGLMNLDSLHFQTGSATP
ncbi:MAG: PQQ-dependent sugar dehydrogenase, partial [Planctomycetota bacterium]